MCFVIGENCLSPLQVCFNGGFIQPLTDDDDYLLPLRDGRKGAAGGGGVQLQPAACRGGRKALAGETDEQGNPAPPSDNGNLNNVVLTKDITSVTYPVETSVCFEAEIEAGEYTGAINEVALIDEEEQTAAKMRLLTSKGVDAESGAIFKWTVEF